MPWLYLNSEVRKEDNLTMHLEERNPEIFGQQSGRLLMRVLLHVEFCSPKDIFQSSTLAPMDVNLFWNRVCEDIIKLRWSHSELVWALIQHDWIMRREETNVEKMGHRKADINTGFVLPHNSLPEAGREKRVCSTRVYGESRDLQIPWLQITKFHNCKIINNKFKFFF